MAMRVVAARRHEDCGYEPKILVEQYVEHFAVPPILDESHDQGTSKRLPVAEGSRLCAGAHGIQRLGHGDSYSVRPQQPDEPVQSVLHATRLRGFGDGQDRTRTSGCPDPATPHADPS